MKQLKLNIDGFSHFDELFVLEKKSLKRVITFGKRKTTTLPGTTIVVPRDPQPFSWLFLARTITPILADTATAIATVEALLD